MLIPVDRWRARMILSNVQPNEWPVLRLKVAAAEELMGKRKDWGQSRKLWKGSYLAGVCARAVQPVL